MRHLLLLVLAIATTGCATITRGTKDTLVVESDPIGADVSLSTGQTGKTPATFQLPRKEPVTVKIVKEGYQPVEVKVIPTVVGTGAAGVAGNVLLGGIIGLAVDAGTGSANDLKPNPVTVKLELLTALTPPPAPAPPLAPAATDAAVPPAGPEVPATASLTPTNDSPMTKEEKDKRLRELEELYRQGKVSDQEYWDSKNRISGQ